MNPPRLYRVILPVPDIERAALVYADLLGTPGRRVSPGRHYFDCGGTILACYDPAADGDAPGDGWTPHENQYLYFAVDDLEEALARARRAGCVIIGGGIQRMPWGERMFWAHDPWGSPISFVDATTMFRG